MPRLKVFQPFDSFERRVAASLAAITPRSLLFAYWVSFLAAALFSAARSSSLWVVGVLAQSLLLLVWFGYPLAILYTVIPTPIGRIGALALAGGVAVAIGLVAYTEGQPLDRPLINVAVFALAFAPFVAGAYGLRLAERRAALYPTSFFVSVIAFVFLPFLASFIHGRVAKAIRSLQPQGAKL